MIYFAYKSRYGDYIRIHHSRVVKTDKTNRSFSSIVRTSSLCEWTWKYGIATRCALFSFRASSLLLKYGKRRCFLDSNISISHDHKAFLRHTHDCSLEKYSADLLVNFEVSRILIKRWCVVLRDRRTRNRFYLKGEKRKNTWRQIILHFPFNELSLRNNMISMSV